MTQGVAGWLPGLLGPVVLQSAGVAQPSRSNINFTGVACSDSPSTDTLTIAIPSYPTGVATWLATPSGANLAAALTSALPISKGGTGNAGAASAISALSIDWTLSGVFTKALSNGSNTFTFANAASGMVIVVRLTGAASTVVWPTVKWAGGVAPTQTASGTDVYTFVHDGTSIYGSVVQAMA